MTPNWTKLHPNCLLFRVSTAFPTKRHNYYHLWWPPTELNSTPTAYQGRLLRFHWEPLRFGLLQSHSRALPSRDRCPIAKAPGRFKFTKNRAHFFDLTACFFSFFFHFSEVLNGLNALRPLSTFPKPFPKAFSKPSPKPSQHYFREASLNLSLNFSYFFPSVFPWGSTRKKIGEI